MTDDAELGDWWEPIESAPLDGQRILLAFPAVERPRKPGETKPKGRSRDGFIRRRPSVTTGVHIAGVWAPGKRSAQPFYDDPTHWMHLPDLPEEYAQA